MVKYEDLPRMRLTVRISVMGLGLQASPDAVLFTYF